MGKLDLLSLLIIKMSKTTFETDFIKKLSAEDRALLEMLPDSLDIIQKKQRANIKQRVYQAVYRNKLKDTKGEQQYKIDKNKEMKEYRSTKKIEYLEAVEKTTTDPVQLKIIKNTKAKIEKKSNLAQLQREASSRIKTPTDNRIITDAPKVDRKIQEAISDKVPTWKTNLIQAFPKYTVNDANYIKFSGFSPTPLNAIIKGFINTMKNVYNKDIPENLKAVLIHILRGNNIEAPGKNNKIDKNNINIFKQHLDQYFRKDKITKFINDVSQYYHDNARDDKAALSTLKTNLNRVTNILSRIDSYNDSYQPLTKFQSELNAAYIEEMKKNQVSSRDKSKLIIMRDNYNLDDIKHNRKLLEENDLTSEEKAVASIYLLQPPRRLDTGMLKLTYKGITEQERALLDPRDNYIVLEGTTPVLQIYNNFKTATKAVGKTKKVLYGQQVLPVLPAVAEYLEQHIVHNRLKIGNYIFGSNTYTTFNKNMSKKVSEIMFKIFNEVGIGAKILRQGAAMYNQKDNRSQAEKEALATQMAHTQATQATIYNKVRLDDVEDEVIEDDDRTKQVKKGNKIPIETKKQEPTPVQKTPKVLKPAEKIGNVRRSKRLNR